MWQKAFGLIPRLVCMWRYGHLLSAYLDNELDVRRAKAIAGHLSACSHCRIELGRLRFANRALVELELLPARHTHARSQVFRLASLREASAWKRFLTQKISVPLPLAASLAIILASSTLLAIFRHTQSPIQSSVPSSVPQSVVVKVVEVPVDRVVIRTVYSQGPSARTGRGTVGKKPFIPTAPNYQQNIAQNNSARPLWSKSTLRDFRPAASANLRIVRESER